MGLGALVVVGVLFAAGFYLPRRLKSMPAKAKRRSRQNLPRRTSEFSNGWICERPHRQSAVICDGRDSAVESNFGAGEDRRSRDASSGTAASARGYRREYQAHLGFARSAS